MQRRPRPKNPPAATPRKRVMHALSFAQPFLQFMALMAVLVILGRCSPLAPSQDRARPAAADGLVAAASLSAHQNAEEEDIRLSLRDASQMERLPILSASGYAEIAEETVRADRPTDLPNVRAVLRRHARRSSLRRSVRLLALSLSPEQRQSFFREGNLRVDLAQALARSMNPELRRQYLAELRRFDHLDARAFLVLADDAVREDAPADLPVRIQTALAFPTDERAYLQLTRGEQALDDSQQELIRSQLDRAVGLAIVLE